MVLRTFTVSREMPAMKSLCMCNERFVVLCLPFPKLVCLAAAYKSPMILIMRCIECIPTGMQPSLQVVPSCTTWTALASEFPMDALPCCL